MIKRSAPNIHTFCKNVSFYSLVFSWYLNAAAFVICPKSVRKQERKSIIHAYQLSVEKKPKERPVANM